jgi:hypothetical protein
LGINFPYISSGGLALTEPIFLGKMSPLAGYDIVILAEQFRGQEENCDDRMMRRFTITVFPQMPYETYVNVQKWLTT